jgi:DNA mismatch endonuclease (patch repair protein)
MPTTGGRRGWKQDQQPPERAYKARKGASPSAEQDRAAGGRHRRTVDLGDGRTARASVALKLYPKTRRIRAVLRWSQDGQSPEKYLGEVDHGTRAANLAEAWTRAWEAGFLVEEKLPADSKASSLASRAVMRANHGKDTAPERALRSLLYQRGLRYRVDARPLVDVRRKADVVFPKERVAVFLDGCYWHGCPDHYRPAVKNSDFWNEKISANRARDIQTNQTLTSSDWTVIRVWEHEDLAEAAERITQTVRDRRAARVNSVTGKSGSRRGPVTALKE